jgi:hypothetical protein
MKSDVVGAKSIWWWCGHVALFLFGGVMVYHEACFVLQKIIYINSDHFFYMITTRAGLEYQFISFALLRVFCYLYLLCRLIMKMLLNSSLRLHKGSGELSL